MKKNFRILFPTLALALALTACDSGGAREAQDAKPAIPAADKAPEQAAREAPAAPQAPAREAAAPAPEDLERADSTVAFYNAAAGALAAGRYAQADALMAFAELYLQEWRLARLPEAAGAESSVLARDLAPPARIFSPEEENVLAACVSAMDKAAASMRADYRALERYAGDSSIQDNGARGVHLVAGMRKDYAAFVAARDSYLGTVEAHVTKAGEILLRGHPLKRQIQAAERAFVLFRKTAGLLTPEKPDREALAALRAELAEVLTAAGRPPFMAAPEVERAFRAFLKQVEEYEQLLARGLAEGFYSPLRQDMNAAALNSRAAYNVFVRAANRP